MARLTKTSEQPLLLMDLTNILLLQGRQAAGMDCFIYECSAIASHVLYFDVADVDTCVKRKTSQNMNHGRELWRTSEIITIHPCGRLSYNNKTLLTLKPQFNS